MSGSTTGARRVRDEVDARACLAAAEAAGMKVYGWARANGVSTRSLARWRERVAVIDAQVKREAARSRSPVRAAVRPSLVVPRMVEVTVCAPPKALAAHYDVVVGRFRVVVGDDFADETLARLLRVVAAC